MRKRCHRRPHWVARDPLNFLRLAPPAERQRLLARFHSALAAMRTDADPDIEHWRVLADATNTLETLGLQGRLAGDELEPLVGAAVMALGKAATRHRAGHPLRLDGPGIQAVADILGVYEHCLETFTGAEMDRARHETELRLHDLQRGIAPKGVEVIAV